MDVNQLENLIRRLIKYKKEYYSGNPSVSDIVYDFNENKLRSHFPMHPFLTYVGYIKDEKYHKSLITWRGN